MEEFSDIQIDNEKDTAESQNSKSFKKTLARKNTIELKTNFIPKGLVPLERLCDNNDVFLNPDSKIVGESTVDCNIGTENQPRYVKVSKFLPQETRTKYVKLLKQYAEIFA